jgi:hypothetical protein
VIHLHGALAWWRPTPVTLGEILTIADQHGVDAALMLAARGRGASDPRAALQQLGISMDHTTLWHWPFTTTTAYLVCATVATHPATNDTSPTSRPRIGPHGHSAPLLRPAEVVDVEPEGATRENERRDAKRATRPSKRR